MRTLFSCTLLIGLLGAIGSYSFWASQRDVGHYLSDLRSTLVVNDGQPGDRGNMLGIQTQLYPRDYHNLERLHLKLAAYLNSAREAGLINAKTIVVLPEHIGTWLMFSGEKEQLYQAVTFNDAMNWLSVSNPLPFARAWIAAEGKNRLNDAYLRMKARRMAADYQQLFGGLAKEFGVTLVAGSIVLPNPSIEHGQLKPGKGALYNSSVVFDRNGQPVGQPQLQQLTSDDEQGYLEPGPEQRLNVLETPAGRLGILLGRDSWYPQNYRELNQQQAQLIAVPAFIVGKDQWQQPWAGYKNMALPDDVSLKPGEVSEGMAWHRLSLIGSPPGSTVVAAMTVFSCGQLWDQHSAGQSFVSRHGWTSPDSGQTGARLLNLWL